MKCSKAIRELLWLSRFGELGPSSQPHLDHLAGCTSCRDEVGFDRAMVQQLRMALAERVEMAEPSPRAWETILERAQLPEPRRGWLSHLSGGLVSRLRVATAVAGTGLAVMVALNMEVVSVGIPASDARPRPEVTELAQVPRLPTGRTALVAYMRQSSEAAESATRPDPETNLIQAPIRVPQRPAADPSEVQPDDDGSDQRVRIVFQLPLASDSGMVDASGVSGAVDEYEAGSSTPTRAAPGEPS